LTRDIDAEASHLAASAALERAVRELPASGLVHRNGDVVLPTRAALRFDELAD
jgi:hypothetical protein